MNTDRIGIYTRYSLEPSLLMTDRERQNYIKLAHRKYPDKKLIKLEIRVDGEDVELKFRFCPKFDVPEIRFKRGGECNV